MGRLVVPPDPGQGGRTADDPAKYGERLAKYVPAEAIAAFLAANTIVVALYKIGLDGTVGDPATRGAALGTSALAFFVLLAFTPVYLWSRRDKTTYADGRKKPWVVNTLIGTLAFVLWAYGLGGAFFLLAGLYSPVLAALLPILATFGLAAIRVEPQVGTGAVTPRARPA